jgi:hypothetical protein
MIRKFPIVMNLNQLSLKLNQLIINSQSALPSA